MLLRQAWEVPSRPRPIVIIGAGAIVRTSHLPAYRRLRLPVTGLFDVRAEAARATADAFGVATVHATLAEATRTPGVVFDVAVPGDQVPGVLDALPPESPVLIQKPMGEDLAGARRILAICRERRLIAAINFQLRFSPNVLAVRDLLEQGALGSTTDIEVRVVVRQPWENWSFLRSAPRLEVLYHSIHYLDVIRMLAGEPSGVFCRAVRHPLLPDFRDSRSSIILDYGNRIRCSLVLNHTHAHSPRHRASFIKIEGTTGSALLTLGVNLDYPNGGDDALEVAIGGRDWESVPLRGSWFTEAFEGPMSNLQRFVTGEDTGLVSPVDDAVKTMALVETCYLSSDGGGMAVVGSGLPLAEPAGRYPDSVTTVASDARTQNVVIRTQTAIDTHQHFWRYRAEDYPWIDGSKDILKRDFLPADLEPLLARAGFGACIAVQARPSMHESDWLLDLAEANPFIIGVVGWVDLTSATVGDDLRRLAARKKLAGIRHIVHDEPDDRFLQRGDFRRGLGLLQALELTYDVLIFPRHLRYAIELAEAFPDQRFVLDHLAKPDIRNGVIEPWASDLKRLARCPGVCAKISGLVTEADWRHWVPADIARYIRVAYDCFGPDRLMLGSDWPVCTLAGDYASTMGAALEFVTRLPASEQVAIRGGNVTRWYPRAAAGPEVPPTVA